MHLQRSAVHLKKVTSVGGTDPAVEVVLRYPKNGFSPADMGLAMAYVGQLVTVTLDAGGLHVPSGDAPRPMDKELERVNGRREERMRPLPDATCARCAQLIGDDPDPGFYTPPAGPPQPMHAACLAEFPDAAEPEEAGLTDEDRDALARLADNPAPGELAEADDTTIDAAAAEADDTTIDAAAAEPEEDRAARNAAYIAGDGQGFDTPESVQRRIEAVAAADATVAAQAALDSSEAEPEPTPVRVVPGRGRGGRR
jgi:hypothetical protein